MRLEAVYEVGEVDMLITEVLLYDLDKQPVNVDLRGKYLQEAEKWKPGDKIKTALTIAKSRFTPNFVEIFDGEVQVLGLESP